MEWGGEGGEGGVGGTWVLGGEGVLGGSGGRGALGGVERGGEEGEEMLGEGVLGDRLAS